ncbi:MAG TPA: hypothetical protein VH040_09275 [Usitatibacter sp.]|jgi:hypothetical protein|nr:hypothetical protein [Usitatibacter sp.]
MSEALHSYLAAWLFVLGLSLGSMANLMVHTLTGGRWGEPVRPAWAAASRLMPFVALAALPILLGAASIFPWAHDPGRWLNLPFFEVRSVAYLVVFSALAWLAPVKPRLAAPGLVIYTLTISLASFDWIVSLMPHWYSSGFGLVVGTGQMLAGAAFGVAVAARAWRDRDDEGARLRFNDLGNLLLMYVLTWAYLAYTQYLVIWSENLPHEIRWYVPRTQTGWAALGFFLIAFHFFVPLLILLSRTAKRAPRIAGGIAAALLVAHLADVYWLVIPSVRPDGISVRWSDPVMLAILLAGWWLLWRRSMRATAAEPEALAHA